MSPIKKAEAEALIERARGISLSTPMLNQTHTDIGSELVALWQCIAYLADRKVDA